jgi:tetratricopeptide (TPR) repeat protein
MTKTLPHNFARAYAARLSESARAYSALIRGDTAAAIDRFKALPDTACPTCFAERIPLAELLIGTGRLQDAARLLEQDLTDASGQNNPLFILWELERGKLAERMGDRPKALRHYRLVEAAWRNADPPLRWAVDSARLGRIRLSGR